MQAYRMSRFICFFDQRPAIFFCSCNKKSRLYVIFFEYIKYSLCILRWAIIKRQIHNLLILVRFQSPRRNARYQRKGLLSGSGSFLSLPFRCFFRLPLRFSLSPFLCAFFTFSDHAERCAPYHKKHQTAKQKLIPVVSGLFLTHFPLLFV